jgi:hypothetical protein
VPESWLIFAARQRHRNTARLIAPCGETAAPSIESDPQSPQ